LRQEVFVAQNVDIIGEDLIIEDIDLHADFYRKLRKSDDYHLIFNFFYGDEAATLLGFPTFGLGKASGGFDYARIIGQ
jgi:hypothetical protein